MKKTETETKKAETNGHTKAVVVTTEHRGVFFGYVDANEDLSGTVVRIEKARMCVYWSASTKSVVGLASLGPQSGSKIGPAVPAITLQKVTSIMEASVEATAAWESAPW